MRRLLKIFIMTLLAVFCSIKAEVFCPICENTHEKFLPKTDMPVKRKKERCPTCNSFARHRHLWLLLQKEKGYFFTKSITLLHWAPKTKIAKKLKCMSNLTYIQADLHPTNLEIRRLDITKISLPSNSIDAVLCSHVLEHVPNDHKAMTEVLRVLKPGGFALFMVPIYTNLKETYEDFSITSSKKRKIHFDQRDHVRKYAANCLESRLKKAGFLVEYHPLTRLTKQEREHYGLAGYDNDYKVNAARGADIFLCTKPIINK